MNILIIDDEPGLRNGLSKTLKLHNYVVYEAENLTEAEHILNKKQIHVILLDLRIGSEDGHSFLEKIKKDEPLISVIIITGYGNVQSAVSCMKAGASNYITKPIDQDFLLSLLKKESEHINVQIENRGLKTSIEDMQGKQTNLNDLIPADIKKVIEKVKDSPVSVLISGETGTGKEIVAQTIHSGGVYRNKPFIGVNCAALNENLLESELFGHEKGAFTGALERKIGRFELAGDGILLLDEIGDMSLSMQAKLLRVLQEQAFERVGGTKTIIAKCKIIAATNKNLQEEIEKGNFREDLYYRLSIVKIHIPPLRERVNDIPHFIARFIQEADNDYCKKVSKVSDEVMSKLLQHSWPGNLRQLKNVITRAVLMTDEDIIKDVELPTETENKNCNDRLSGNLKSIISRETNALEKELIKNTLEKEHRNIARSAQRLGITRKTLYEKMKSYGL